MYILFIYIIHIYIYTHNNNNVAVNVEVHVSFQICIFVFSGKLNDYRAPEYINKIKESIEDPLIKNRIRMSLVYIAHSIKLK